MKVKKILAVLLSFCLLFGAGSSLNVKAAAGPSDDSLYTNYKTSAYNVKIGYKTSKGDPVGWYDATDYDGSSYRFTAVPGSGIYSF